jgi:predicted permease
MRLLSKLRLRLRSLAFSRHVDAELDEEMRGHLERQIEAYVAAGMSPDAARDAARRDMGGVEHWKDACRDARGLVALDSLAQDVRYALRMLRRSPVFTFVSVLVMSIGIGANTAVFSVVNAVLLNPLPYDHPERIVTLTYGERGRTASSTVAAFVGQVSAPDAADWRDQSTTFEAMTYYGSGRASVMAGNAAEHASVSRTRPDFFRVYAVSPAAGRFFTADEEKTGADVAVVTAAYARQHFGDPARALGQTLRISDRPFPIVGVLPSGFATPDRIDVWLPMPDRRANTNRRGNNYRAIGRLKPSATLEQGQAEMSAIAANLARAYPDTNAGYTVLVTPIHRAIVGDARMMLLLLLGAVGLVLLVACANMATLMLARATARTQEIGVRMALGAGRARIVRQLVVEGLVQSLLAGGAALLVAVAAIRALVGIAPGDVPRLAEASLDLRVLAFTLAACVLVSVLTALPPALHAAHTDVNGTLGQDGGRSVVGGRTGRTREALVVIEIALSVVLLAGGGLLVRSLLALQRAPLGYQPEQVLAMETTLPGRNDQGSRANDFFSGLLADISTLPGVVAVGATMAPPGRVESTSGYFVDHLPKTPRAGDGGAAIMSIVAPGTFAALGVPIRTGRDFLASDTRGAGRVVIINDALAREAFRGQDPLGRTLYCAFDSMDPMTIVGVVGDVRQYGPALTPSPECYMPALQHGYNNTTLTVVIRTAGAAESVAEQAQRLARQRAPTASVRMSTLERILADNVAAPRFRAILVGLFAAMALCLSMAGIYGVMACHVSQRATEIGLRLALGATPSRVMRMFVGRGLLLAGVGLALGLAGAAAATRLLSDVLFEIGPGDPTTHLAVVGLLALVSFVAVYVPTRRSTRVSPLAALRQM